MRVIAILVAGALALPMGAGVALADNPNWSDEKAAQVDANRNSNAGRGNGGERLVGGEWVPTINGEDGGQDVDPGNSAGNNNACPTPDGETPATTAC